MTNRRVAAERGRGARLGALALALLVLGPAAHAADRIALGLAAPFGGWGRPARQAELELRLTSAVAGRATVTIDDGARQLRTELDLAAGEPHTLRVPASAREGVTVVARLNGEPAAAGSFAFRLSEDPLIVWAAGEAAPPGLAALDATATSLPHLATGYQAIDALVVDARALESLDAEQLEALTRHLGTCGRTVLLRPPPGTEALLRHAAGCRGAAVATAATAADAARVLGRLFDAGIAAPAPFSSVSALRAPGGEAWRLIAAALIGYLALVLLLALGGVRARFVIAGGALAGLALLALPRVLTGPAAVAVWAEAESGDAGARYAAVVSAPGRFPGATDLALDPRLENAEPCPSATTAGHRAATWDWDERARRFTGLHMTLGLLDSASACFRGRFPLAPRVALVAADDERITVSNAGETPWGSGRALIGGRSIALAPLPAGQSAHWPRSAGGAATLPEERLALDRGAPPGQLLWRLALGSAATERDEGWLLLHGLARGTGP